MASNIWCRKETYHNPIIQGFAPDPSVVLVDGTFFLVASSFHIFPGIPIYASKDLKSWTQIGNAINRTEQIDLSYTVTKAVPLHHGGTMIGAGGLFAPTIRYHQGTFYIVCTNVGEEGDDFNAVSFYISTTDIWKGEWTDPTPLELRGIDPSLFIDDDGRAYIQGAWRLDSTVQPYSTIKQYEIDIHTGQRLSEIEELWPGSAQVYTEGPHIYKKDGFYYLLVAEGGTFEHHMLSIGRSRDIWGPYEGCPQNPILTAYGKPEVVQDAGHGEFFQDSHGLWWATVLGVRKVDARYPMGRETFLTQVDWPEGEWPRLHHPQLHFERVVPTISKWTCMPQHPRVDDCFIRTPQIEDYKIKDSGICLRPSLNTLAAAIGTTSFVGKRQQAVDCDFTAIIRPTAQNIGREAVAGLAVYKDDFRSASIAIKLSEKVVSLTQRRVAEATVCREMVLAETKVDIHPGSCLQFRIAVSHAGYEFSYQVQDTGLFIKLGAIDAIDFTGQDFTGTILGVFANRTDEHATNDDWVVFEDVGITEIPPLETSVGC